MGTPDTPTAPVVRCGDTTRSHDEVRLRAARLATALREMGLAHGERYAVLMRNDVAFVEATLAGAALGAIPVPINWHWTGAELEYLVTDSDSKIVVAHTSLIPALADVLPAGVQIVEATEPEDLAEIYGLPSPTATGRYPLLETLIADHEPLRDPITEPPLSVIYTSGTTGRPKGIVRQPISPEDSAALGAAMFEVIGLRPGARTLATAPLYHTAPNTQAVFAVALGCDLEIMPKFDTEGFLRLIEERRVEHAQVVPTMLVRVIKLPAEVRSKYDLSSLKAIVHAAAPCPPDVKRAIIEWLGPIVLEYYGGSETGACVACTSQEWLAHPGTVGRGVGGAEVRILDPVTRRDLPAGEDGDIYIKPLPQWPDFTYLGNDVKRRDMEVDGYLNVGDIGHLDVDGFLHLSDRRNDMVISGGVNIYPAEIESCIIGLDGVADVAVFGIPDPDFGESVAAHVELAPGASLTEDDIRAHVAGNLAKYKVPKVVVFEPELPRHDSGKLFKRILKDPYWQRQSAAIS